MSNTMLKIRLYNQMDRDSVRQICCDVADRGEAIENIFSDREIAADLLTSYYTDYEPENSFVAEKDGRVVAYINACLDNRRYGLVLIFLILPKVILKGAFRGLFIRPEFWQMMQAMSRNWKRVFVWRKKSFSSHQGHLHIGVSKEVRGQRVGEELVKALFTHARLTGVTELAASVHDGNLSACRFFERLGFTARDRYPMIMAVGKTFTEYYSILYVKTIH